LFALEELCFSEFAKFLGIKGKKFSHGHFSRIMKRSSFVHIIQAGKILKLED